MKIKILSEGGNRGIVLKENSLALFWSYVFPDKFELVTCGTNNEQDEKIECIIQPPRYVHTLLDYVIIGAYDKDYDAIVEKLKPYIEITDYNKV